MKMKKILQNALSELIEKDMREYPEKLYRWTNQSLKSKIYDLRELAEDKWYKTLKIDYYEAWIDLEDIIDEMEDKEKPLSNDVLKWLVDEYQRLKKKRV